MTVDCMCIGIDCRVHFEVHYLYMTYGSLMSVGYMSIGYISKYIPVGYSSLLCEMEMCEIELGQNHWNSITYIEYISKYISKNLT